MSSSPGKGGFTLVEILVAMAIIVIIVSIVYGSYFATSKSSQAYKSRIALSQQGRKVLEQMARQIRGSYAVAADKLPDRGTAVTRQAKAIPENGIDYFNGDIDGPDGQILHLVTTNGFSARQNPPDGLFEVTYRLDESRGLLLLNQRRFAPTPESTVQKKNWQPIAKNIACLELAFFDGQQWSERWNFKDMRELPRAVKISITCEDENHRQYQCGTITYICCWKDQGKETQSGTLVSVNK